MESTDSGVTPIQPCTWDVVAPGFAIGAVVKNLSDLPTGETPRGFRDSTADAVPVGYRMMRTGNIVPEDMSSGSNSAKRKYFEVKNGCLIEIGASTVPESEDKESKEDGENLEAHDVKRAREEEDVDDNEDDTQGAMDKKVKTSDKEDKEDTEEEEEEAEPFVSRLKCGREQVGSCHAQCLCLVCLGEFD